MENFSSNRPSLSVAIITFNEEKNIKDCLDSVNGIADEIVVYDSFSGDGTEEICRSFDKVKFVQHAFDGHVNQKNRALQACSSEWILSIDADERVTPELQQSIIDFLQTNPTAIAAKFPRLTYHMQDYIRHGGWYPNARYRLVKKGYAKWGGENPHDVIEINGDGVMLTGDLIHYSFVDLGDQVNTINKFSTIKAFTRFEKGQRFSLLRMFFKPFSKFIEIYFLKRGMLDGIRGLIIAVSSAYSAFLVEAKIFELDKAGVERLSNLPKTYKNQN